MIKYNIKNFSFQYDKHVFDIDYFAIPDCGLVAVKGESGSGKSTLFKIIVNQIKTNNKKLDRNDYFYVDQFSYLKKDISILKQFQIIDYLYHNEHNHSQILTLLQSVCLDYLDLNASVNGLSTGEKKRLLIALGVYSDASLIIIDEPISSLDYEIKNKIMKFLKEISYNKAILISTHNNDFDYLYDYEYEIIQHKIILKSNQIGEDIVEAQNKKLNIPFWKLFFIKSKKEYFSLISSSLVISVIISLCVFQMFNLFFHHKNSSFLLSESQSRVIQLYSEGVERDKLPKTYIPGYGGRRGISNKVLQQIKNLPHVEAVYTYYQVDSTNYLNRIDNDDERKHTTISVHSHDQKRIIQFDANQVATPSLVSYYKEENIKKEGNVISGNYISEDLAKILQINENSFSNPVTITIEVGIPVCSTWRNNTITFFETDGTALEPQFIEGISPIYKKVKVSFDIHGILPLQNYSNNFINSGTDYIIYVENDILETIINKNQDMNVEFTLYDELNEKVIPFQPCNYAVIVDNIDMIKNVKDKISSIDHSFITYARADLINEMQSIRENEMNNLMFLNIIYIIFAIITIFIVVFLYIKSKKQDYQYYRNRGLDCSQLNELFLTDFCVIGLLYIAISMVLFSYQIVRSGEFIRYNNTFILFIFALVAIIMYMFILFFALIFKKRILMKND